MTTETLQTAMRLLTLLDQESPSQEITVKTIIKEEERMLKGRQTCSDPITIDQACEIIGRAQGKKKVSRPTVFRYLRDGDLKRYRIKKKPMLSRAEVIEFVTAVEA